MLNHPNVTIKRCNTLNPASLLPLPEDGEPHSCLDYVNLVCTPRPDLKDEPIPNSSPTLLSWTLGCSLSTTQHNLQNW